MNMLDVTRVQMNKLVEDRKASLEDTLLYHKFVSNCQEFQTWLLDLDKHIKSVVSPNSVAEAELNG